MACGAWALVLAVALAAAAVAVGCGLDANGLAEAGDASAPPRDAMGTDPGEDNVGQGQDAGLDAIGNAPPDASPDACPSRPAGDAGVVVATPAAAITIDGVLDDWVCPEMRTLEVGNAGLTAVRQYSQIVPPDAGTFPIRADYAIAWDPSYLYFAVVVHDAQLDGTSTKPYENDAVEIYLSTDPTVTGAYTHLDHQYVVDYQNNAIDYGPNTENRAPLVPNPASLVSKTTSGSGVWTLEARVDPSNVLGLQAIQAADQNVRLELQIDDNAGTGGGGGPQANILIWHRNTGPAGDCSALEGSGTCCAGQSFPNDAPACDNTWFGWILPVTP
jgi:hypothetical protein